MKPVLPAEFYASVAQESMFAIAAFTPDGRCIYSNRMAEQLLGRDQPTLEQLNPGEDRPQMKSFSPDILRNDGLYQDILVRAAEGRLFIANIGVQSLTVDQVPCHLLMFQDVTLQKKLQREILAKQTEIKNAYEELLKQNRQLRELDLAKDRFIALTTHELRTPLSAMVASAEILKLGLFDGDAEMKEFIDMIHDQGLHLQELVNDILDFAKIQAGKMEFYLEEHDLVPLTGSIARNFEGMAETNNVTLDVIDPGAPQTCYFDELRLRQVLSNIINNAIKYNRPGGTVTIRFETTDDVAKVFVKDTGKGIPREQFDKVFNEFETVGQVENHQKGTGLGMPISRRLVEGMGGTLQLESEVGAGSTFWIEIPRRKILDESIYRARPEKLAGDHAA